MPLPGSLPGALQAGFDVLSFVLTRAPTLLCSLPWALFFTLSHTVLCISTHWSANHTRTLWKVELRPDLSPCPGPADGSLMLAAAARTLHFPSLSEGGPPPGIHKLTGGISPRVVSAGDRISCGEHTELFIEQALVSRKEATTPACRWAMVPTWRGSVSHTTRQDTTRGGGAQAGGAGAGEEEVHSQMVPICSMPGDENHT